MDRISSINYDAGEDDEGLQVNTADMEGNTNPALVASNAEARVSGNSGPAGIISLSIKKLAEKAKSSPCQPRLSQSPLCAPWQPQAVKKI